MLFVRKIYINGSQYMRHVSVISEHPIFTGFHGLTGCQPDPRDKGVTSKEKENKQIRNPGLEL